MKKSSLFAVLVLASIVLGLSACGKVSSPEPLEGSGYPHTYPRR